MSRLIGKTFTITPKITTFTSSGTFTADPMSTECHLLVVAGGGGGSSGGGGGGGYREFPAQPIPTSPVPVTVGAGGAGTPDSGSLVGSPGANSIFASASDPRTSTYGGSGGAVAAAGHSVGQPGGSSGGAGGNAPSATEVYPGNAGDYDPPEGNTGGYGRYNGSSYYAAGGGGGAGGDGGDETPDGLGNDWNAVAGQGGLAKMSTISGSKVWYAGGGGGAYRFTHKLSTDSGKINNGPEGGHTLGGGSIFPAQKGGAGNANDDGAPSPTLGTASVNTGGGGGGICTTQYNPSFPSSPGVGAAGGSGIVIVSEPNVNSGGVWDYRQVFQKKVAGEWR